LRVSDVTDQDSGQYTIKAVNDAGQTSCTATLLVHGICSHSNSIGSICRLFVQKILGNTLVA